MRNEVIEKIPNCEQNKTIYGLNIPIENSPIKQRDYIEWE